METGSSQKIMLSQERLDLAPDALRGRITHHGWTLDLPEGASLTWPIYPHNPYSDAPETTIAQAVGRLTVPLALKAQ